MTYKFICEIEEFSSGDIVIPETKITVETNAESLDELMQEFRLFLLGVGFAPEIINDYVEAN